MHFSGPTGVGKSMTAQIIAESLFTKKGAANLCGYHYVHSRNLRDDVKEETLNFLARHLQKCPSSMFVFDEIQSLSLDMVNGITAAFDKAGSTIFEKESKTFVSTAQAIVILISDMGRKVFRSDDMPHLEAAEAVRQEATKRSIWSLKNFNIIVCFLRNTFACLRIVGLPSFLVNLFADGEG